MNAGKASKLALGGAQFGMRYGIANATGQPPCSVIAQIFRKASKSGVSLIDTAQAYGDSEAVVGRMLGEYAGFRVVTKTRPIRRDAIGVTTSHPSARRLKSRSIAFIASAFTGSWSTMRRMFWAAVANGSGPG